MLESVILSKECLLVFRDLNIRADGSMDIDTMKFFELLESFVLHVTQPIHIQGSTLDLIVERKRESLIKLSPRHFHYFSDHKGIHSSILHRKTCVPI